MAQSTTEIANLALSHLGSGKDIADLATERSAEAAACRRFMDIAKLAVFRDHPWPFATRTVTLSLVKTAPTTEWSYSYRYPADCLRFRRILSGTRNDSRQSRVPYRVESDVSGKLIYTDSSQAQGEYTARIDDVLQYPPDFVMALAARLAVYIAPRVTAGDPFKVGDRAMALYFEELSLARANAANEEEDDEKPDSEFIRSRS